VLVKQGLEEKDVDWIVENVPEAFDPPVLLQILRVEQSLAAADAICRIAIVHGGDVDDSAAAQLTQNTLSQLVDSFYLILGPVGVSVSALLIDDSETDITQKSRKAAFRILKSLIRVRSRRKVFLPCGATLQKLAGLVKSESAASGLTGTVANKRKQLLKEIFDATSKSVGVLGQNNY
jgi:6,7-dimethyl-8-ribityllumazine synthase